MKPNYKQRSKENQDSLPLFHIGWSQSLHDTCSLTESCPEDTVRVLEHAVLQRDNDELGSLKPGLDQTTDVLCVRQVQSSVHFVQNVHRSGFELQESHDQRQSNKGSVQVSVSRV